MSPVTTLLPLLPLPPVTLPQAAVKIGHIPKPDSGSVTSRGQIPKDGDTLDWSSEDIRETRP